MTQAETLDIVIVNWNSGNLLRECLQAVIAAGAPTPFFRVIVVDNASTDDSMQRLPSASGFRLAIIRNAENRGFAAACNQGAAAGDARHILFLNPDTFVSRQSLQRPLEFMQSPSAADVGICGVQLTNERAAVSRSCSRFPTPVRALAAAIGLDRLPGGDALSSTMKRWDHRSSRYVDQVIGAFFMVKRELFHRLGGFDERFFVYYEEVDFSLRASKLGWRSYYLAEATAQHVGGGTTKGALAFRQYLVIRSRVMYFKKHFGLTAAFIHMASGLLVEPIVRATYFAGRGEMTGLRETLRAMRMLWTNAPQLLRPAVPRNEPSTAAVAG